MPSDFALKTMNRIHRAMMTLSGGKLGWTTAKMPVLELTTTGRKSGQQRSSMLTTPWQDGETMALVASAGGNDNHPAWFLNLQANPSVQVRTQTGTREMAARILTGAERTKVFEEICQKYSNYGDYQAKTEREIPVVLLTPKTG